MPGIHRVTYVAIEEEGGLSSAEPSDKPHRKTWVDDFNIQKKTNLEYRLASPPEIASRGGDVKQVSAWTRTRRRLRRSGLA
ncbi:hypothetical protein BaRGS_00012051 [Batillaria attramentaria]|uniref:Uncharacterized protein n=1 Tax=Batillaria attramentaria TaxID=370345 RepID=A0ABD0LBV1_9CAEN